MTTTTRLKDRTWPRRLHLPGPEDHSFKKFDSKGQSKVKLTGKKAGKTYF